MKIFTILLLGFIFILSCNSRKNENIVFKAGREAPLGVVMLTLFREGTFHFENKGLLDTEKFSGRYKLSNDTLSLEFKQKQPRWAESVFVINDKRLTYVSKDGRTLSLEVLINNFKK